MEGDNGASCSVEDVFEGLSNCWREGELVPEASVDHVLDFFEDGVSRNYPAHTLGEEDFGPIFRRDVVSGVDHPESFLGFGSGDDYRVSHRVVGAGEGDILGIRARIFAECFL